VPNKPADTLTEKDSMILQMARTEGWGLISEMAEQRIAAIRQDLETGTFENLSQISYLQGELRGLKTVLNYAKIRLDKFKKESGKK